MPFKAKQQLGEETTGKTERDLSWWEGREIFYLLNSGTDQKETLSTTPIT